MDDISNFVKETIREANMDPQLSNIADEGSLRNAGLDSLDAATILLALEERYDISISDEDFEALDSVNDIVEYIKIKCQIKK